MEFVIPAQAGIQVAISRSAYIAAWAPAYAGATPVPGRRADTPKLKRLVILISGRGSNMAALIAAARAGEIDAGIAIVISNRPDAAGLTIAAAAGVATSVVDHRAFADRSEFERTLTTAIDAASPDLVVLAGFMRILSPAFVAPYGGRMLNIHPSLLPAYPG